MGQTLGMNIRTFLDGSASGSSIAPGLYFGAHVEVKLSTHIVWVHLTKTGIIDKDVMVLTKKHLQRLNDVLSAEESNPQYIIYLSRKPCQRCRSFVKRISAAAGFNITIDWRQRLAEKEYRPFNAVLQTNTYVDDTVSECGEDYEPPRGEVVDLVSQSETEAEDIADLMPPPPPLPVRRQVITIEDDLPDILKPLPATPVDELPFEIVSESIVQSNEWFRSVSHTFRD